MTFDKSDEKTQKLGTFETLTPIMTIKSDSRQHSQFLQCFSDEAGNVERIDSERNIT